MSNAPKFADAPHSPTTAEWDEFAAAKAAAPGAAATVERFVSNYLSLTHGDEMWLLKKGHSKARGAQKPRIPRLKPHTIPAYIAAVAREVQAGKLTPAQGNGLLYAAQLLVSAMRVTVPPPPTPNPLGFAARNRKDGK